jgi:hypothetical protein
MRSNIAIQNFLHNYGKIFGRPSSKNWFPIVLRTSIIALAKTKEIVELYLKREKWMGKVRFLGDGEAISQELCVDLQINYA